MKVILEKVNIQLKNEEEGKGEGDCNASEESRMITHKCKICKKAFGHKVSLERHKTLHTENNPIFHCDYCERSYKRKDSLAKHMRVVHKRHNINMDALRKPDEQEYKCEMCGQKFGDGVQQYENHIVLRACQKNLENIELDEHLRLKCSLCEKTYSELCSLKRHIKEKHNPKLDSAKESSIPEKNQEQGNTKAKTRV